MLLRHQVDGSSDFEMLRGREKFMGVLEMTMRETPGLFNQTRNVFGMLMVLLSTQNIKTSDSDDGISILPPPTIVHE